ncbi:hypothetical protein [Roseivirga sp.]|uniref:hypothetical protein n=1 Tax=Roseivirga sp. TaxID=1964215 RepID=UPI003B8CE1FC
MKQVFGLLIILLFSSSCTALFNSRNSSVEFKSNESARYIVQGDTIEAGANDAILVPVKNGREPLKVKVTSLDDEKDLTISSFKPAYYWANILSYGAGFIVDEIVKKQFTYPNKVYVDFTNPNNTYQAYFPIEPELLERTNIISISPLTLIGGVNPGIELSYQRLIKDKFAVQVLINKFIDKDNEFSRSPEGFRLQLEGKQYFRNQQKTRFYSSINLSYLRKNHEVIFDVEVDTDDNNSFDENFFTQQLEVEKRFISLTPRIGFEHYLSKRLVLDAFFGIGVRYRDITVPNLDPNLRIVDDSWLWFGSSNSLNRPSSGLTFNFDMNFKIGWVF